LVPNGEKPIGTGPETPSRAAVYRRAYGKTNGKLRLLS